VRKTIKDLGSASAGDGLEELNKARALELELLSEGKLGWIPWAANSARWAVLNSPKDYAPF
jgi:hypothetical protein